MQFSKSIRIKVTGSCNRKCSFCHKEGNMANIEEMSFNQNLKNVIAKLSKDFSIERIALTGGEPFLHSHLNELVNKIYNETSVKNISITTNGTIPIEQTVWNNLKTNGLCKVNVSIPEILDFASYNNDAIFNNQIKIIEYLNRINVDVDVNIVVFNDYYSLENIVKKLVKIKVEKNLFFNIVLLPNINSLMENTKSLDTIKLFCNKFRLENEQVYNVLGTSNSAEKYVSNQIGYIYIKTTKLSGHPYLLESMCSKCNIREVCQEGFYGIRLECRKAKIYVRLCIHKDTDNVVMPFGDFIKSNYYKELSNEWRR